jgi:hypothetical protein
MMPRTLGRPRGSAAGRPKGTRNGNYKHGRYTALVEVAEAVHTRREGADHELRQPERAVFQFNLQILADQPAR